MRVWNVSLVVFFLSRYVLMKKNWTVGLCASMLMFAAAAQANAQRVSDGFGVTEWEEWGFANKDFWIAADDQDRSNWFGGSGMVAIADGDEWDDTNPVLPLGGSPDNYGTMNSQLKTPAIPVAPYGGQTGTLSFNSSWRPEFDDYANQSASVEAIFDGVVTELLRWNSNEADTDPGEDDSVVLRDLGDGRFQVARRANTLGVGHGINTSGRPEPIEGVVQPPNNPAADEVVSLDVPVPAGASNVMFTFNYFDGTNDWWWAIDNIDFSVGGTQVFFEDFESLQEAAKPANGGGGIDEDQPHPETGALGRWSSSFDLSGDGTLTDDEFELLLYLDTPAYTQTPPAGWSITPDYTGPVGSWANNNGQTFSAPGINGNFPTAMVPPGAIIPEPAAISLFVLAVAGISARRRR
jgi:hypothetical protein